MNNNQITDALKTSWEKIAPCWPINNIIAVNPLKGFEDLHFKEALDIANFYFQKKKFPEQIEKINILTIKWLQLFFDDGQASIEMPLKKEGLFKSIYELIEYDSTIINKENIHFYKKIFSNKDQSIPTIIEECLNFLNISENKYHDFFLILLTTLPGWASYIQYKNFEKNNIKIEYIALRLLLICLTYPTGKDLLDCYKYPSISKEKDLSVLKNIEYLEKNYQKELFKEIKKSLLLNNKTTTTNNASNAQLIFCIDVRSEGFRKTIESLGNYETYGFAGFFGLPIKINNLELDITYQSCPVLLSAEYEVTTKLDPNLNNISKYITKSLIKIYQSLKYNICTSFALAESIGGIAAFAIFLKTFMPKFSFKINKLINQNTDLEDQNINFESIPNEKQCFYALNFLKNIGLTDNFADLIVLIGHASQTENNAYSSALDCGACAGRSGGLNAIILASILNKNQIREYLKTQNIVIPQTSIFLAGEHITTTDDINIFNSNIFEDMTEKILLLKNDLNKAQKIYSQYRSQKLNTFNKESLDVYKKATNWSETRPEWGLAQNASFIIAPRYITKQSDLDGRSFLHSYDWQIDSDGNILKTILNGPMIVGQWINAQYLFSTIDNVAFGTGSKITHNITGKIGVMQGNGSDLMNGLPLQSVYLTDTKVYHQTIRLFVVIYAPKELLNKIIDSENNLQKLIKNEWIFVSCINPSDKKIYTLTKNLTWTL